MKIVQVLHGFPPYNIAGSEVYTLNLSKELAKQHKVIIFHRVNDSGQRECETRWSQYHGLDVFTVNNTFKYADSFMSTYKNETIANIFDSFLENIKPDIVHFGHLTCLSTTCVEKASQKDIPVILTLHDYWLICPRSQFLTRKLQRCEKPNDAKCSRCMAHQLHLSARNTVSTLTNSRVKYLFLDRLHMALQRFKSKIYTLYYDNYYFFLPTSSLMQIQERKRHVKGIASLVDLFIAPSLYLMKRFIGEGFPIDKLHFSDYGFNTSQFTNHKKNRDHRKISFGYIGTIIPSKGIHVLIKAFNRMTEDQVDLKIFGEELPYDGFPNYTEDLINLSRNRRIKLCGPYRNEDVGNILSTIDVLVVPSIWVENSPLTIHEAVLADVPVIASDIGGMAELIKRLGNGVTFKCGDENDLFKKLLLFVKDPQLIEKYNHNSEKITSISSHSREIEHLYLRILESKKKQ